MLPIIESGPMGLASCQAFSASPVSPTLARKPLLPPGAGLFEFAALLRGEWRAELVDGMHGLKPD